MTQHDEQKLREQIQRAVPEPPDGLRDACADTTRRYDDGAELWHEARPTTRRLFAPLGVAAGVVVVAALALVALTYGGDREAAAQSLAAALETLDDVAAVRVVTSYDDGPGTERSGGIRYTGVRGLGSRFEDGDNILLYSEEAGVRAAYEGRTKKVVLAAVEDAGIQREMFKRTRAEDNVVVLHAIARREAGAVTIEQIEVDGRPVRRLTSTDEQGRAIMVELDMVTNRVLRTEAWTRGYADAPAVRVVTVFDYPDPRSIDPRLFDVSTLEAKHVEQITGVHLVKQQVMVNIRDLLMMVQLYASQHDDGLPESVDRLAPYAQRPLDQYLECEVPGLDEPLRVLVRLDEHIGKTVSNLAPTDVLFECDFGTYVVAGFADGHVEVLGAQDAP